MANKVNVKCRYVSAKSKMHTANEKYFESKTKNRISKFPDKKWLNWNLKCKSQNKLALPLFGNHHWTIIKS